MSAVIIVSLFFLWMLSFVNLIIGLIKPSLVIRWESNPSRKTVLGFYGAPFVVFFVLIIVYVAVMAYLTANTHTSVFSVKIPKVEAISEPEVWTKDTSNESESKEISSPIIALFSFEAEETNYGGVFFYGKTNLPEGTKIYFEMESGKFKASKAVVVKDGAFKSDVFLDDGKPLPKKGEVRIISYFSEGWQSPEVLKQLKGYTGDVINFTDEKQKGIFIKKNFLMEFPSRNIGAYSNRNEYSSPSYVTSSSDSDCGCSYDQYNCSDFSTHSEAQDCYDKCMAETGRDVHRLDRDNDGDACERNR